MRAPKVVLTSILPGNCQRLFQPGSWRLLQNRADEDYSYDELLAAAKDADAVVSVLTNKLDENFFSSCPDLKIVANVAVGYDNIDMDAASRRKIVVCNTPGVLTESTADLAFALMLAVARRLSEAQDYLRAGHWKRFSLNLLLGSDVHHKTLGIIGMGRIGKAVAQRAAGFSMKVLYQQRTRLPENEEHSLSATYASLEELLQESDFVSIHCPANSQTHHLIAASQLALMKKSAFLINSSRGSIVDESALYSALSQGQIAGAGLDVFEHEPQIHPGLLTLENVLLLPHIGSASLETRGAMARMAVEAVLQAFSGKEPASIVNKEAWSCFEERLLQAGLIVK